MDYREIMYGCLIALDKQPGIHPVVVGETWISLFDKYMLRVTGPESTSTCQDDHIFAGLKAVIDGEVHGVQDIWDTKSTTRDWGLIPVVSKNSFNKINLIGILSIVCHLWTSGARFIFSCYRHWSLLVLRNWNGKSSFLHSREGLMQVEPLSMVAYGILVLLLIKNMEAGFPDVTQSWCAGDVSALGTFTRVKSYFNSLNQHGPGRGYYPEPSKSVMITNPENIEARFFWLMPSV